MANNNSKTSFLESSDVYFLNGKTIFFFSLFSGNSKILQKGKNMGQRKQGM
jgi:hypothetical protein